MAWWNMSKKGNEFQFAAHLIFKSGKTIDEVKKMKPRQLIEFIKSNDWYDAEKENTEQEFRYFVRFIRRCIRYESTFDINKVERVSDALRWWCAKATTEEKITLIGSDRFLFFYALDSTFWWSPCENCSWIM